MFFVYEEVEGGFGEYWCCVGECVVVGYYVVYVGIGYDVVVGVCGCVFGVEGGVLWFVVEVYFGVYVL